MKGPMAVSDTDAGFIYVPFIWDKSEYKMVGNKFHLK